MPVPHEKPEASWLSLKKFHLFSKKPLTHQSHYSIPSHIISYSLLNIYRAKKKKSWQIGYNSSEVKTSLSQWGLIKIRCCPGKAFWWNFYIASRKSPQTTDDQAEIFMSRTLEKNTLRNRFDATLLGRQDQSLWRRRPIGPLRLRAYLWAKWTGFLCWKTFCLEKGL